VGSLGGCLLNSHGGVRRVCEGRRRSVYLGSGSNSLPGPGWRHSSAVFSMAALARKISIIEQKKET
jgi:hypothetical protein